jgi:hypothetical protein
MILWVKYWGLNSEFALEPHPQAFLLQVIVQIGCILLPEAFDSDPPTYAFWVADISYKPLHPALNLWFFICYKRE